MDSVEKVATRSLLLSAVGGTLCNLYYTSMVDQFAKPSNFLRIGWFSNFAITGVICFGLHEGFYRVLETNETAKTMFNPIVSARKGTLVSCLSGLLGGTLIVSVMKAHHSSTHVGRYTYVKFALACGLGGLLMNEANNAIDSWKIRKKEEILAERGKKKV